MCMQVSLWQGVESIGEVPGSVIVGSFQGILHIDFHIGCARLYLLPVSKFFLYLLISAVLSVLTNDPLKQSCVWYQVFVSFQAYIKLGDYEKALVDCDWALKVRDCFPPHVTVLGLLGPCVWILKCIESSSMCVIWRAWPSKGALVSSSIKWGGIELL